MHPEQFLSDVLCSGGRRGVFICSSIAFVPMFSKTVVKKTNSFGQKLLSAKELVVVAV